MTDALVPIEPETTALAPVGLFGGSSPAETVRKATEVADALADVIRAKHLYKTIGAKNHVLVEAWTLCGTMLGVYPVCVWTRKIEGGWEARVEARTLSGAVVGAAEASCMESERNWKGRDDYAIRSMAQTRATGKAMRQPLGFVVVLAGYEATPAEEMPKPQTVAADAEIVSGVHLANQDDMSPLLEASIAQAEAKKNAALDARCPECASITEVYASTQKGANAGRKYRQCSWAHEEILSDMGRGVPQKDAYAAMAKHLREWVEPPRKTASTQGAAPEADRDMEPPSKPEEPAPSIFEQLDNISKEQERKWAKK